jgi:hypothetical protein
VYVHRNRHFFTSAVLPLTSNVHGYPSAAVILLDVLIKRMKYCSVANGQRRAFNEVGLKTVHCILCHIVQLLVRCGAA